MLFTSDSQRLTQYFEHQPVKKIKSHSPASHNWDTEALVAELERTPAGTKIVWQQLADRYGITGSNRGQICKEYVSNHTSVDLSKFTYVFPLTPKRRQRVSRKRLQGGEVSCPVPPTPGDIKLKWEEMIQSGVLSLGIPCVPYALTKIRVSNGGLVQSKVSVYGRKIPLLELRTKLLRRHEKFMRLPTDEELDVLPHDGILRLCNDIGMKSSGSHTDEDLRSKVKLATRQRYLAFWHDHATILGQGYLLVTVSVMYDCSLFTQDACQAYIEEPEIHILGLSSSSEDQLAFIADRNECLKELSNVIHSSNSIPIKDIARFFIGDHPAQSFERGTQQGGYYKCGGCGIHSRMIGDFAHAANQSWRPLEEIQALAVKGCFGKSAGKLKPFYHLSLPQLKQELTARGQFDVSKLKPQLLDDLSKGLKGVQRVPTLLISHPTLELIESSLDKYEVLDSEPLHDIKGHLSNLFEELPFIVGPFKEELTALISNSLHKEKINCADLRCLSIQCCIFLVSKAVDWKVKLLIITITELTHIVYAKSVHRTPKLVLRLYNLSWLHHELCFDLFPTTRKISMAKMFGTYFHSLLVHAPSQYELISLSSVNTEKQERLFGQARMAASTTSNRKPENIIKSVLLHLQSKLLVKDGRSIDSAIESRVSKLAKSCSEYQGTSFSKSFIQCRPASWQSHLRRISPFLEQGPGSWWEETDLSFDFFDGLSHSSYQNGPELLHFRNHRIPTIIQRCETAWKNILEKKILIPATEIKVYDEQGDVLSIWRPLNSCLELPTVPVVVTPTLADVAGSSSDSCLELPTVPVVVTPTLADVASSSSLGLPPTSGLELQTSDEVIVHLDELDDIVDSNTTFQYKYKLCNVLARLLGDSNDLKHFDEIRVKVKKSKSKYGLKRHDEYLVKFQAQALRKKTHLKEQLISGERASNCHEEQAHIYKSYSLAVKLLRSWDITLSIYFCSILPSVAMVPSHKIPWTWSQTRLEV